MLNNKASVSIEAAISLVVMMAVMLTLNMFIKVTYVHSIVQHAIIQSGNEMATYNYVLSLLGINEINDTVINKTTGQAGDAAELTDNLNSTLSNFSDVINTLQGEHTIIEDSNEFTTANSGSWTTSVNWESLDGSIESAKNVADNLVDENGKLKLMELFEGFIRGAIGEGVSAGKSVIFSPIAKAMASTYIPTTEDGGDLLAKNLVVGGVDGLDFSRSKFFDYPDTDVLEINCTYTVKVVSPIPIIEYITLSNNARVRTWQAEWEGVSFSSGGSSTSIWIEAVDINKEIVNRTISSGARSKMGQGIFDDYKSSSKTAIQSHAMNIITSEMSDATINNTLNSYTRDIRNYDGKQTVNGEAIKTDDINTVKMYIYVPNEEALRSTEEGQKLTEAENKLAKELAKDDPNDAEVTKLKNEVKECEKALEPLENKLKEKTGIIKAKAKEKQDSFNQEGNYCTLKIYVKAVNYPADTG